MTTQLRDRRLLGRFFSTIRAKPHQIAEGFEYRTRFLTPTHSFGIECYLLSAMRPNLRIQKARGPEPSRPFDVSRMAREHCDRALVCFAARTDDPSECNTGLHAAQKVRVAMTANFGTNSEPFTGTARFALVREIGAGGMGIVFEAEDKERSSRVALKTLHRLNPSDLYRFKKEFRCLQSLVHPNLVTLYELIADKGHWFLTMELVDGKDFLTYVRDDVDSDGTELESVGTSEHPQPQTWTFAGSDPAMGSSDVTNRSALSTKLDPPLATTIKQAGSPKKEICDNSTRSEGLCPVSVRMQNSTEMAFSLHENGADNLQVSSTPALEGDDPACDVRRLCGLLEQFADALHFLHEAGMLHRDLKPSNVLVTPTGRVVILDFGLVMEVRGESLIGGLETENAAGAGATPTGPATVMALTDQGLIVGTVKYMAPEQAAGMPLTPAADWYSFGVILYQALVGELPFNGTAAQILAMKRTSRVTPPNRRRRGIPDHLNSLCVGLLQSDAVMRPSYDLIKALLSQGRTGLVSAPRRIERSPFDPPFVGRESELAHLRGAYKHLLDGGSAVVLVAGSSGNGKTSLVRRFVDHELNHGRAIVLAGRCFEQESVPFKAVDSLVDSLSRYLISLSDEVVDGLLPRDVGPLSIMFPVLLRSAVDCGNCGCSRAPARPARAASTCVRCAARIVFSTRPHVSNRALDRRRSVG